MANLFLHIGMHKTGSTALQMSLLDAIKQLNTHQWDYCYLDPLGNSSLFVDVKKENGQITTQISSKLDSKLSRIEYENTIISGEHFSVISQKDTLEALKTKLSATFDSIKIVVYLRRQDKLALSFKQQASKGLVKDKMLSSMLCGHSDNALPDLTEQLITYLTYCEKLDLWSSIFGQENLLIADFDNLVDGDISIDFSHRIGLPFTLPSIRTNEGVKRRFSLLSHKMIDWGYEAEQIRQLRNKVKKDDEKVLPSRDEASKFYHHFNGDNKNLAQKYKISFLEDFSAYPESSSYYFNDSDIKALVDTLTTNKNFQNPISNKDIDTLIESAINLESINLDLALSIMKIAQKLRPKGTVINKKIELYKKELIR